jgi:hypothetical protein
MEELVPFQTKRKKQFPVGTTQSEAVLLELTKHFKKVYPEFVFVESITPNTANTHVFGTRKVPTNISLSNLAALYLQTQDFPTLKNLELFMLNLQTIALSAKIKRAYLVLPKPYQMAVIRQYSSMATFDSLATELASKKRAKKYLRILQKRMGIYTKKKPGFIRPQNSDLQR